MKKKVFFFDHKKVKQTKNLIQGVNIKRFPRNKPCFCNSGKKYKNCHFLQLHASLI